MAVLVLRPPPVRGANFIPQPTAETQLVTTTTNAVEALELPAVDANMDQASINRKENTVLDTPENRKMIEKDIKQLAQRTLETRAAFERIGHLLAAFDNMCFKTKDNTRVEELSSGWDKLSRDYDSLLKDSHNDALAIKSICDKYAVFVLAALADKTLSREDVQDKVNSFIAKTKKAETKASAKADRFDRLRVSVETFRERINQAFEDADADPEKMIPQLRVTISELRHKVEEQQALIQRLTTTWQVSAGAAGVGAILCAFCPIAGALMLGGGLIITCGEYFVKQSIEREMAETKSKLNEARLELSDLSNRESIMRSIQQQLINSNDSFDTIISQLGALTNFWTAVRAQCVEIVLRLEDVEDADTVWELRKAIGHDMSALAYAALSQALGTYASQMSLIRS